MVRFNKQSSTTRAFSLVELVMVVTIIGIISAIAVPRLTTASGSATAAYLDATLSNVRKAIDMYFAEHGSYPGHQPGTTTPDSSRFIDQLVKYSDARGNTNNTLSGAFVYGPYLRAPFPKNPFNMLGTVHVKAKSTDANPADGSVGWVAVLADGHFGISAPDADFDQVGIDILEPGVGKKFRGPGLGFN